MFIQTESTPNPATLKFLPGQPVMEVGSREFRNEVEAEASPLAEALFSLGDVTGVLFGRDFVAVTAAPGVDWSQLKPQVVAMLLDHFIAQAPLFAPGSAGAIAVPAEDSADIFPRVGERILAIPVEVGQYVEQGAVLVQLDRTGLELRLRQAR